LAHKVSSYDGAIVATPQQLVRPQSVDELQAILRKPDRYPSPVRAMGSYHSLTPCASSTGTMVDMKGMKKVLRIDAKKMTFTAEAGLEIIEASKLLRKRKLQMILNIEIGNLTLGSAACCHTKDSLDAVELGQIASYVTAIKWVTPTGELAEASEDTNPDLLALMRSSYGLAGIIYEVTLRIKPLEIVKFDYEILQVADLTQAHISRVIANNQCMVTWTIGDSVVIQTRNHATKLRHEWLAESREFGWNFLGAFAGRIARRIAAGNPRSEELEDLGFRVELGFYRLISKVGGFTLYDPDKTIDYSKTPEVARYAFTFWTFPRKDWVANLQAYVKFRDEYFRRTGFRCNLPLGSYFIRKDRSSLLSYTWDGDMISLDPIHAPGSTDKDAWARFLREFNEFAKARGGVPLLNQSPFVTRDQVVAAYGDRWKKFSNWIASVDPARRMVNEFFAELLV
jgi:FAD/FMN-containing dehydrogenase